VSPVLPLAEQISSAVVGLESTSASIVLPNAGGIDEFRWKKLLRSEPGVDLESPWGGVKDPRADVFIL
jgi:hypothetical protein